MRHLRYCMRTAHESGVKIHPQEAMKALGIEYENSIPQSIGDQWWFLNVSTNEKNPATFLGEMYVSKDLAKTFSLPDSYINEK